MSIGVQATNYWRARKKPVDRKESWVRPLVGTIKINVDVVFDMDQGRGGMGAVARDYNCKFMLASCKEVHFVENSSIAEVYALRDGLSLAQHLDGNTFVIQLDNIQVIH
jgi:ribonuclease HI